MHDILLVTETSGGGTGRHILDLARQIVRRNHRVHIIYAPNRAEASFEQEIADLQGIKGLTTSSCEMMRQPGFSDLGALRRLKAEIRAHGR